MVALTIGMATYEDFDGTYFTIQALRFNQDLTDCEILIIDNFGCDVTKRFAESVPCLRYIRATEVTGTAAPRDRVFREAQGEAVLCVDSHVLLAPKAITRLKDYYRAHPGTRDLLQGPLLHDGLEQVSTHLDPVWRAQFWGTWGTDERGANPKNEPFDIPMQGLGLFSCRRDAWLGFNPRFRAFGGEEGYIHEKFRQAGARCLCLPFLCWLHRFGRPRGVPYPASIEDKLRNYLIGHTELGLDIVPIIESFRERVSPERIMALIYEVLLEQDTAADAEAAPALVAE